MTLNSWPLLQRRVVIVTGKGGTGKTTISASIAAAAARRGRRVLIAELGRDERVPPLFEATPSPLTPAGREIHPGLFAIRIDPFDAMEEYLRLQGGPGVLLARGMKQRGLHDLLVGAPGWRELITLGKIWYLEQLVNTRGEPEWDLIVVDAPATGHGLTLLDVPRVVHGAVRSGPLARNAARVEDMLRNPEQTLLLPVCLPEELPVRETLELIARMRGDVGVPVDRVVVNQVATPSPIDAFPDLERQLETDDIESDPSEFHTLLHGLAAASGRSRACSAAHRRALNGLREKLDLPLVELPQLPGGTQPEGRPDAAALLLLGEKLLTDTRPGAVPIRLRGSIEASA